MIAAADANIRREKAEIQPWALEQFEKTGEKNLLGGIGIRETSTIEYNADAALKFAKEKDMFLALDKKAFEKAAPALGVDFVTVGKKVTVTFPKEVKIDEIK